MFFIYNILLVFVTLLLAPFFCAILLLRKKHRCGFLQKCGLRGLNLPDTVARLRPIWVHAVSVGEVMAAIPFINAIKERYPGVPVLLSTVTETGHFTARQNVKKADHIIFFPFDYPFIVRRIIAKVNPRIFVTLEGEIWPNFLCRIADRGIPSMIVSGRVSGKSFRNYHFFRFFFAKVLAKLCRFSMQTEMDAQRIMSIGAAPHKVTVAGNVKFDQQAPPTVSLRDKDNIFKGLGINNTQPVFVAGSTHRGEEETVLDVYRELQKTKPELILLLAPRHPERFDEAAQIIQERGIDFIRKTAIVPGAGPASPPVILLDTIGELSKIYSIATLVFIGGSLVPVGGHNVLEPAVFSKPVIFGPFMANFSEISRVLQQQKAAFQVADKDEFIRQARALLDSPELCRKTGTTAFNVIRENSGAVKRNMEILEELLETKP